MVQVIEVGPVAIRRLGEPSPADHRRPSAECVEAALGGIDDAVALLDEHPVDVDGLWRNLLGGMGFDDALIVHPSWWPQRRLERLAAAAAVPASYVRRCDFIAERIAGPVTVVEVDSELVTVAAGTSTVVVARHDVDGIADAAGRGGEVLFDAPAGVGGADVRHGLTDRGIAVCDVDVDALCAPAAHRDETVETAAGPAPRRRTVRPIPVAAVIAAVALVLGLDRLHPRHREPPPQSATLVEGRIAVVVPARWAVQRITGGPGSRRLQVSAPADTGEVLHITGAYVPEGTVASAAEVLGRAVAAQPAGVFTDFRTGSVAGRDAVTYTENRPGRLIRWSVLQDGATRISIGCQSSPDGQDTLREACEQAVRSARESVGTAAGR